MQYNRYLYETHLHTQESSRCAHVPGAELARLYKEAGYTGIVITDHFINGNTAVDRELPWNQWVDAFCKGYENAKAEGDNIGLQVFFGWEAGYKGTEFLIYGLDKKWIKDHPEIAHCSVQEQYALVHASGGIVVHAHPFRIRSYIKEIRLFPEHVDAVEGYNAAHSSIRLENKAVGNDEAVVYAQEHHLPMTAGSDQHNATMLGGGMVFSRKLENIQDFCKAVMNREAVELLDGSKPL